MMCSPFSEEEWKRYYQSLGEGQGFNAVNFSYDYYAQQQQIAYGMYCCTCISLDAWFNPSQCFSALMIA